MVAHGDSEVQRNWYADTFQMNRAPINPAAVGIILKAQGLPLDTKGGTIALLSMNDRGNMLELDGYVGGSKGPRPRADGQLPPGNSMATFEVSSLGAIKAPFVSPPARLQGAAYGGKRSAVILGPGGEPVELIET